MYIFYSLDPKTADKVEKAQFTPPDNWSGDYQSIKDVLHNREWDDLGNKKFNPNNKKHVNMLPKIISGTYLWCEKRNISKIIKKDTKMAKLKIRLKGGGGSGYFGHAGRPGKVGGSAGGKGGGKKKVGTANGSKRRAATAEKRKVATAEHQKKYGKPTGKGTTADGLAAVEYAMIYARPTPADVKKIKYKVYKKGIKIQDIDGQMGHTSGSVDTKYLKSKFGFTPEKFVAWLDDNGASKIK